MTGLVGMRGEKESFVAAVKWQRSILYFRLLAHWPLRCLSQDDPSITARAFRCPHDPRLAPLQLPIDLCCCREDSSLMHGSVPDQAPRVEKEHVPLLDVTPFLSWICIQQRPRGTSFYAGEQRCNAGQLVSVCYNPTDPFSWKVCRELLGRCIVLKWSWREK